MKTMAEDKEESHKEEGKKEKQKSSLESALNESSEAAKASFNASLGTGAIGASALFGLDGLVTALSFPYGGMIEQRIRSDGKGKFTSKNFRDESIAGMLFTPAL